MTNSSICFSFFEKKKKNDWLYSNYGYIKEKCSKPRYTFSIQRLRQRSAGIIAVMVAVQRREEGRADDPSQEHLISPPAGGIAELLARPRPRSRQGMKLGLPGAGWGGRLAGPRLADRVAGSAEYADDAGALHCSCLKQRVARAWRAWRAQRALPGPAGSPVHAEHSSERVLQPLVPQLRSTAVCPSSPVSCDTGKSYSKVIYNMLKNYFFSLSLSLCPFFKLLHPVNF